MVLETPDPSGPGDGTQTIPWHPHHGSILDSFVASYDLLHA